ncbi:MAG: hypothetical protein DRH32_06250 [Deltaproteobacteria bacterium]|nr:MAG: hypothetical protein DRH32_06250 [Deltaproteobacteria bacterium]
MKIETNYFHIFFWELFPNFYDLSSQINLQNLYLSYFRASVSDPVAHSCRLLFTDKDHTGKACAVQLILQKDLMDKAMTGHNRFQKTGSRKYPFMCIGRNFQNRGR